jgi:CheY-like chemotaxis protein
VPAVRVLLVEDEGLIRLVAAETVREAGFEVVEAWDGDEAARLLDGADGFDVLFTDVRMPGTLDGIDVAVHARRRDPGIAVLVVSGYAAQIMSRLAVLEPPAVFIHKPYDLEEIVKALRGLTRQL